MRTQSIKMNKPLLALCVYLLWGNLFAQGDIEIETSQKLRSDALNQEIELQIYLPKDYDTSDRNYPTLYVLDGQWYFINGVAIQESLRGDRIMPKMIVVGINMVDRPYRSELFNQWDNFITFIESELVSHIDKSFRTSDERIVFGWENSGYLTSELILRKDSPFSCSIAVSGAYVNQDLIGENGEGEERYFFIAGSKKDIYSIDETDHAAQVLDSVNLKGLKWKYELFNKEEHETLAYASMYQGLRFFYHNYGSLVFSSIDAFEEMGGIPYLRSYFKSRGERFDLPTEIDVSTKNSLIWLAWKRDRFEAFDLFMTEFEDVLSTRRYANSYWQNRLAQYYLTYEFFDTAISFFERGLSEYPDERYMAEMQIGLGSAYLGKGDKKLARKHFKKGIEIARAANNPKLTEYEKKLEEVRN